MSSESLSDETRMCHRSIAESRDIVPPIVTGALQDTSIIKGVSTCDYAMNLSL